MSTGNQGNGRDTQGQAQPTSARPAGSQQWNLVTLTEADARRGRGGNSAHRERSRSRSAGGTRTTVMKASCRMM